MNKFRLILVVY